MNEDVIEKFAQTLVEEKNIQSVNTDVQNQIKDDLKERIEDHINMTILNSLPTESLEAFDQVIDSGDDVKIQEFCSKHIDNLDEVIAKTLVEFRSIYLNNL